MMTQSVGSLCCVAALLIQVLFGMSQVGALRTGAPSMACLQMRPLHGLNRPKPASASQFFVTQSSLSYSPGDQKNITVEIATHSNERRFKGFLVKAYDPINGHHIGQFLATPDSRPIDSCSAATHRNHQDKKSVSLIWQPPVPSSQPAAPATSGDNNNNNNMMSDFMASLRSLGNQKRQLPATVAASPSAEPNAATLRQVRFKATIVASYSEFYTDFESSEKIFEEFGYSKPAAA